MFPSHKLRRKPACHRVAFPPEGLLKAGWSGDRKKVLQTRRRTRNQKTSLTVQSRVIGSSQDNSFKHLCSIGFGRKASELQVWRLECWQTLIKQTWRHIETQRFNKKLSVTAVFKFFFNFFNLTNLYLRWRGGWECVCSLVESSSSYPPSNMFTLLLLMNDSQFSAVMHIHADLCWCQVI